MTIANGSASVNATAGTIGGPYTVTAIASGVANPATFALTNVAPPTVATGSATSVARTSATLNGSVNAKGSTTTVRFEYSTTPNFVPTVQTTIGSGFSFPLGMAVDAAGDVFAADSGHNAVKEVKPDGTILTIGSGLSYPRDVQQFPAVRFPLEKPFVFLSHFATRSLIMLAWTSCLTTWADGVAPYGSRSGSSSQEFSPLTLSFD